MKSLFIKPEDEIEIKIYVAKNTDETEWFISDKKESLESLEKTNKDTIVEHKVLFRVPSYGDDVIAYSKSIETDGSSIKVNGAALQYERFITLLKSWSFCDGLGNIIPTTDENVRALSPELAALIIDGLDRATR